MVTLIKKVLLVLAVLIFFTSCSLSINSLNNYDTLSMNVSDVALDRITNTLNLNSGVVYTGTNAKNILNAVTVNALSTYTKSYIRKRSYSEVYAELSNLNLPSDLLYYANNDMTAYVYLTAYNEYKAYFVEDVDDIDVNTGSIYILYY